MESEAPFTFVEQHPSRRTMIQFGGAVAAALFGAAPRVAAASASTPVSGADDAERALIMIQSFSRGSLFPTQGDPGVPPYTLILWDAETQGAVVADPAQSTVGFVPTARVLDALASASELPLAVVVAPPEGERASAAPEAIWVLRLSSGGLGADPGAVTYQGEVLAADEASRALGIPATTPPDGPRDVAGYLLIVGLPATDLLRDGVILPWN